MADKSRQVVAIDYSEPCIATVTIDYPPVNALTPEMLEELDFAFQALEERSDVRVVVLTSRGSRAFVAGADINVLSRKDQQSISSFLTQIHDVFNRIDAFPKPTICAINSHAAGNGCELAMVCDIRIASETARFSFPECRFGVVSAGGSTQRLPRLIPQGRALYYLYTSDEMSAAEALSLGFIDFIQPMDKVYETAMSMARRISLKAPLTASSIKRLVRMDEEIEFQQRLKTELESSIDSSKTYDFYEGMTAYLEKRDPVFKGK